MVTISYIVKMKFYQYNTGTANNGYRIREKSFDTEAEAWDFFADVKLMQINGNFPTHWSWDYVDEGYLDLLMGVYKVIHEVVPLFETDRYRDCGYEEVD